MALEEKYVLNGYHFETKEEYTLAQKEWETVCKLESKIPVGDPKAALQLYNQAVSKKTFKTVIGYAFLTRLRDTIVSCGLVEDKMLHSVPIVAAGISKVPAILTDRDAQKYKYLYQEEKQKKKIMKIIIFILAIVIFAMFAVTVNSKYSFITYFTNYEDTIRNEIIDEYQAWEADLKEREEALNE